MPTSEVLGKERICEWCAKPIDQEAIKCPFCHKWRNDINKARQIVIMGFIGSVVLAVTAVMVFLKKTSPDRYFGNSNSIKEFLSSGAGRLAIILLVGSAIFLVVAEYFQKVLKRKTGSYLPF